MQKWEYLTIDIYREKPALSSSWTDFKIEINGKKMTASEFDKYINTLGEQGWELVSVTPIAYYDGSGRSGMTSSVWYYFKRQKP